LGSPMTDRNGATATAAIAAAAAASAGAETEVYQTVTGRPSDSPTEVVPTAVPVPQARPVAYRRDSDTSSLPPVPPEDERRGSLGGLWGALAASALVGLRWFAISNLLETDPDDGPQQLTVPSVVGDPIEEAQA